MKRITKDELEVFLRKHKLWLATCPEGERADLSEADLYGADLKDIHSEVQKEVNKEYDSIKDAVLKEITASASKIDASRVRRDVEDAAKKAALEKFDDNLDNILEKFNENLDNTSKIYSSIRETLTKDSTSGKQFVVTL